MTINFNRKKVVIFGGSGFIGKNIISRLSKYSCSVDVVTRKIKKYDKLKFLGDLGQINILQIKEFNEQNIYKLIKDSDIVINLIGILYEKKYQKFNYVHIEIPKTIAKVVKKLNIKSFIHLSALGVDKNIKSDYAKSKFLGEKEIKSIFPNVIIIRPSVVFGSEDNFINTFINISKISPFLPVIGTPKINIQNFKTAKIDFSDGVKFQPVYVGDLSSFILSVISKKKKTYDLAGPNVLKFEEIIRLILKIGNRTRICIPLPLFIASCIAFFAEKLPKPFLTLDQIQLLKFDNVSSDGFQHLQSVVKYPKSLELILPTYFE